MKGKREILKKLIERLHIGNPLTEVEVAMLLKAGFPASKLPAGYTVETMASVRRHAYQDDGIVIRHNVFGCDRYRDNDEFSKGSYEIDDDPFE